ncbi:hypothetical protein Lsed01_00846 [Demequina sediminis]|uniref:Uncharacterized protein n=1 Tax=Demequina sediminis TaxID=1930058 RepID=A0ABP9WFG2_9MICO
MLASPFERFTDTRRDSLNSRLLGRFWGGFGYRLGSGFDRRFFLFVSIFSDSRGGVERVEFDDFAVRLDAFPGFTEVVLFLLAEALGAVEEPLSVEVPDFFAALPSSEAFLAFEDDARTDERLE